MSERNFGLPQLNRRAFALTALGCGLASSIPASLALTTGARGVPVLLDRRDPRHEAIKDAFSASAIEWLGFDGDVTRVWRSHLRAHWRSGAGPVLGFTRSDSLFCLAMLARDAGQRLVHEEAFRRDLMPDIPGLRGQGARELAELPRSDDIGLRFWMIDTARKR